MSETGVNSDPAFCLGPTIKETNSVSGFGALGAEVSGHRQGQPSQTFSVSVVRKIGGSGSP